MGFQRHCGCPLAIKASGIDLRCDNVRDALGFLPASQIPYRVSLAQWVKACRKPWVVLNKLTVHLTRARYSSTLWGRNSHAESSTGTSATGSAWNKPNSSSSLLSELWSRTAESSIVRSCCQSQCSRSLLWWICERMRTLAPAMPQWEKETRSIAFRKLLNPADSKPFEILHRPST